MNNDDKDKLCLDGLCNIKEIFKQANAMFKQANINNGKQCTLVALPIFDPSESIKDSDIIKTGYFRLELNY